MATIKMDEEFQEQFHQFKKYKFDFENLAFAGGGAKIASYLGGIMVRLVFVSLYSIEKTFKTALYCLHLCLHWYT